MNTKKLFILIMFLFLTMPFLNEVHANDTILIDDFETVLVNQNKLLKSGEWAKKTNQN